MKTILLILIYFFLVPFSFGQVKHDSIRTNKIIIKNSLRVGAGIQENVFAEVGFARHKAENTKCYFGSKPPHGYYSTLEWTAKTQNKKNVFGIKVGYETSLSIVSTAIEAKYLTNFENKDFVITPKIGFGSGDWYVFYGYNISTNVNPFGNVGKHQFSIVFNLNKDSFKD